MNSSSLLTALDQLIGSRMPYYVVAADNLCENVKMDKFPIIVIQNTDRLYEEGTHWVLWFIVSKTRAQFFDSFGNLWSFYKYIEIPTKYVTKENNVQLQDNSSNYCGLYCLDFAYKRSIGIPYETILSQYSSNTKYNDWKVKHSLAKLLYMFNPTSVYDKSLINQICRCKSDFM